MNLQTIVNQSKQEEGKPEFAQGIQHSSTKERRLGSRALITLLYYFDRSFTSRITSEKNYFFIFVLNQKKIYRPSRSSFFQKS